MTCQHQKSHLQRSHTYSWPFILSIWGLPKNILTKFFKKKKTQKKHDSSTKYSHIILKWLNASKDSTIHVKTKILVKPAKDDTVQSQNSTFVIVKVISHAILLSIPLTCQCNVIKSPPSNQMYLHISGDWHPRRCREIERLMSCVHSGATVSCSMTCTGF